MNEWYGIARISTHKFCVTKLQNNKMLSFISKLLTATQTRCVHNYDYDYCVKDNNEIIIPTKTI